MAFRKILDRLTFRAVTERLDKRKLQQEIDVHRLYLLTSHREAASQGSGPDTEAISAKANSLTFEEGLEPNTLAITADHLDFAIITNAWAGTRQAMSEQVSANLRRQLVSIAHAVHESLLAAGDPAFAAARMTHADALAAATRADRAAEVDGTSGSTAHPRRAQRGRGLAAAVGASAPRTRAPAAEQPVQPELPAASGPVLSMHELAKAAEDRLGFAVHRAPSGIEHEQAGDGLWLSGTASPGSIVALYPGIIYNHQHYRHMPGYPKIDRNNDTLLARYDGAVIDALPWVKCQQAADEAAHAHEAVQSSSGSAPTHIRQLPLWQVQLETRQPLALAQVANHPAPDIKPNVMVAAYDFTALEGEPAWLRAYLPNVIFEPHEEQTSASISLFSRPLPSPQSISSIDHVAVKDVRARIGAIAFVATRELHNEELLLNYRLSPHVSRPAWYRPVDEEEDQRRWG